MSQTYRKAGVNIAAGEVVVERIKRNVRSTFTKNVLADIGSFGAFYRASFPGIKDPVLVSSVDGVGTKLKIAFEMKRFDSVGAGPGQPLRERYRCLRRSPPLFHGLFRCWKTLRQKLLKKSFLDLSKPANAIPVRSSAEKRLRCRVIYRAGEFDIAGTIVGVVERKKIIDGKRIEPGDVLIGLPSTGLHTNGYSLARKYFFPVFRSAGLTGTERNARQRSSCRSSFVSFAYPFDAVEGDRERNVSRYRRRDCWQYDACDTERNADRC